MGLQHGRGLHPPDNRQLWRRWPGRVRELHMPVDLKRPKSHRLALSWTTTTTTTASTMSMMHTPTMTVGGMTRTRTASLTLSALRTTSQPPTWARTQGRGIQTIDKTAMTVILAEAFQTNSTQVNGTYTLCASTLTLEGWDVSTGSWSQIGFLNLCAIGNNYSIGDAIGTPQSFSDMGAYKFTLVANGTGTSVMHYVWPIPMTTMTGSQTPRTRLTPMPPRPSTRTATARVTMPTLTMMRTRCPMPTRQPAARSWWTAMATPTTTQWTSHSMQLIGSTTMVTGSATTRTSTTTTTACPTHTTGPHSTPPVEGLRWGQQRYQRHR